MIKYHIFESDNKFLLVKTLELCDIVESKIVGSYKSVRLAEDAIPANSAQSGNISGVTPGDPVVVNQAAHKRHIKRILKRRRKPLGQD